MGAHLNRHGEGGRYYALLAVFFVLLLSVAGGASRADELQQTIVRLGAICVIAAALWPLDVNAFRGGRTLAIGFGLLLLLLFAQLIPMPAPVWAQMPGHRLYWSIAEQSDARTWRPWTVSPDLTLNALAALLPATAVGLLGCALDFRGRLLLARVVLAIACASALLGLMQFAAGGTTLHLFRTTSEGSAVGVFANRNHQAVLMAVALPITAALASISAQQDARSGRTAAFAGSILLLLLMGLAATGSRMGILLGLVGIGAAAAITLLTTEMPRRMGRRWWLGAAAAALVASAPIALLINRSGSIARLASDPVDQTRAAAFAPMLQAARAFFPFGAGFGTFDPVYRRFEPDSLLSTIYLNQAHNEPMQLAIEGGLPALLLLLLFLVWWIQAAAQAIRPTTSGARRALGMAMVATTLILMLSSLVDYPLRTPMLSGVFAFACTELARAPRRFRASLPS